MQTHVKFCLIGISCFILGSIVSWLIVSKTAELFNNEQQIRFQQSEIIKGALVAEGNGSFVVAMVKTSIEQVICKSPSMQSLYQDPAHKKQISQLIQQFYTSLKEEPPAHVKQWLQEDLTQAL